MTIRSYFLRFLLLSVGAGTGFAIMHYMAVSGRGDSLPKQTISPSAEMAVSDGEAALPLSFARMDGLMQRYGRMTSGDAARELEKVWSSPSLQKDGGAAVMLYYLAYRAGASAIPLLDRPAARGERKAGDLLLAAVQGWADRDLAAATQFIQQNKKTHPYLLTVLTDTAKNRMASHFEEVEKWMKTLDRESRPAVMARILDEMAVLSPDKFFAYVEKLPSHDLYDFSLCGVIARRGAVLDWERTLKWVDTLPKNLRWYGRGVAWGGLAEVDPERARKEYERTKDMAFEGGDEIYKRFNPRFLISALSAHSPIQTLKWLERVSFPNYYLRYAGEDVIRGLKKLEPDVEEYICQMPDSALREGALMELIDLKLDVISYPDYPRELVPLVAAIPEKEKRRYYMSRVLRRWGGYSPDEARNFFRGNVKRFPGLIIDLIFYTSLPEERENNIQGRKAGVFPIDKIRSPFCW